MKTALYILLSLLILPICSCVEEYEPDNELFEQKLITIAELEADELGFIHLGTTFGVNTPEVEINHTISVIEIINFEEGNKPEEYRYRPDLQVYYNELFKPKQGNIYDLNIDPKLPDLEPIYARTQVPYAVNFDIDKKEIVPETVLSESGDELSRFTVKMKFSDNINNESYFHLIPYIDDAHSIKFDEILNNKNAIHKMSHRDGILLDKTKLENTEFLHFSLLTTTPLEISGPESSHLYFELRSVTSDYYKYHLALSRQNASNAGPYTLPVTTYTNIENGYGIFAAYSTTLDSVLILK